MLQIFHSKMISLIIFNLLYLQRTLVDLVAVISILLSEVQTKFSGMCYFDKDCIVIISTIPSISTWHYLTYGSLFLKQTWLTFDQDALW